MSQQDAFERVVASLHETALDDSLWDRTSGLIDVACRSMGNQIAFRDDSAESTGVLYARFCLRGQRHKEAEREYYGRFFATDEHVPRLWQLPDSRIVHVRELFSEQELKTSPTYNEGMARSHARNALKVRLDGPDNSRIFLSVGDPLDADGWSSAQTRMIGRLLPHLRHFLRVRHALGEAEALGQSLGALRENNRAGVVVLDRRGRIGAANDLALALLRRGEGLFDEDAVLRAREPKEDVTLQRLVGRAIPPYPVRGAGGSMRVSRPKGKTPLLVHISPVEQPQTDFRPRHVAAFVLVVDPRRKVRIDAAAVEAMLGLTPAESEVAVMLAEGLTVREIAQASGRGHNTVRWHVYRIFDRLGVSRQLEVARLVLSLADLPQSALRPQAPARRR